MRYSRHHCPHSHVKKYLKRKLQDKFKDTQDPEVNIEVKMVDYLDIMLGVNEKDESPQISTTKCNDNADTEDEELKKHTDTLCKSQKHEVSDSNSILSDDDDFLVVATKVTPPQPVVFSPLIAEIQVEVRLLLNILPFSIPKVQFFGRGDY